MELCSAHRRILLGRRQGENDRSFKEFLASENNRQRISSAKALLGLLCYLSDALRIKIFLCIALVRRRAARFVHNDYSCFSHVSQCSKHWNGIHCNILTKYVCFMINKGLLGSSLPPEESSRTRVSRFPSSTLNNNARRPYNLGG